MVKWILQKIVGNKNQREVKRIRPIVAKINEIEEALQTEEEAKLIELTRKWQAHLHRYLPITLPTKRELESMDAEILTQIAEALNERFTSLSEEVSTLSYTVEPTPESIAQARELFQEAEGAFPELRNKYLNQILPEAFAVVKNGARRLCGRQFTVCEQEVTWEMIHYDVQLVGGVALHRGLISEMQTGEGKTLVGTLPVYLNALTGLGVHVITVNDYLARRDAEWMGNLFNFLGLSIGIIQNQMPPQLRKQSYMADITYGTNSEFGFDYLRDNGMSSNAADQVQRSHYFAIIDEVDSILIDEARTPLIISGPSSVGNNAGYEKYKGTIEALVKKQNVLCNELANEAKQAFEAGDPVTGGRTLFKLKLGQPRNRQLMRFLEDPDTRRALEKAELSMYEDTQKKDLFAIKEELFYTVDEKAHEADLMEQGRNYLSPDDPEAFVLPDLATSYGEIDANLDLDDEAKAQAKEELQQRLDSQGDRIHAITQLLKGYCLYEKDVEYVVKDNKVIIVDENTGREMAGRRWSEGLHQAVEAKEGCVIEEETQTYATITIQNYFRLYEKLAGMTGTAETDAAEFHDIYRLDVLPIPTNKPNQRIDENDQVFKTRREKFNAVVKRVAQAHEEGQPVLIGTASVEASETLARMLKIAKVPHKVLNAKFHRQEAEIIQQAGLKGAVTVATNMAGRGTDIKLEEGVFDLGGLLVIGTERHTSRRIDRQLRGRCARQGDAGKTQFFLSFEDDLMRNFAAADRMTTLMERFGMEDGEALEHGMLNRSVETAQKRVEQVHYRQRKYVLDFDDVMNQQREVVYGYRNDVLKSDDPRELIYEIIEEVIPEKVSHYLNERDDEQPDYQELYGWVNLTFPLGLNPQTVDFLEMEEEEISAFLIERVKQAYELKVAQENPELLDMLERQIVMSAIDRLWQEHLYSMDGVRQSVHLRQHGQKDPLVEYKTEAYELFISLMDNIKNEGLNNLFRSTTNLEHYQNFLNTLPTQLSSPNEAGAAKKSYQVGSGATSTGTSANLEESGQNGMRDESKVKVQLPKRRPTVKPRTKK